MRGLRTAWSLALQQTKAGFTSLKGSPRDLYLIFCLKVFESYNYFSLSRSMTLYLTEEFGLSDYRAGTIYGLWGTLLTAYGFILGGLIDYMGVKLSLVVCFIMNICSRIIMASTTSPGLMLAMLLGPNTVAGALGVPVMTIGVKRFTNEANRGFAFSCFYSLMNVAALTQGMLMDVFRIGLKHGFGLPGWDEHALLNSGFRMFLASGCLTSLAGLVVTFFLSGSFGPSGLGAPPAALAKRKLSGPVDVPQEGRGGGSERTASPEMPLMLGTADAGGSSEAGEAGGAPRRVLSVEETLLLERSATSSAASEGLGSAVVARRGGGAAGGAGRAAGELQGEAGTSVGAGEETPSKAKALAPARGVAAALEGIKAVLSSKGFWKYMCMCVFTVNLKSIFRHLDATLPKMQLRAYGCDTPIGLIYSINPAMIVLLVPVVGAMLTEVRPFDAIHWGGYISALSPFWMVAFDTEWSTAAFVAMLSLGEAIWSPRWYDYSMSVAPDGREGIFTALSAAPLFLAMLPTGMVSGWLLQTYCPDNGECVEGGGKPARRLLDAALARGRALLGAGGGGGAEPVAECNGRMLWLIVGLLTLTSPIAILITQRWIRPTKDDFAKVGQLPTHHHRSEIEGEHFDVNEADPTALVENVYQARSEPLEGLPLEEEDEPELEERPLLTVPNHASGAGAGGARQ